MATIRNLSFRVLEAPAAIFNAAVTTDPLELDNGQAAHFVIATGEGTVQTLTASIYATKDDNQKQLIRTAEIKIGDNAENKIVVRAREIAVHELRDVYIEIPNASDSDIIGTIFVVLTNERYSS